MNETTKHDKTSGAYKAVMKAARHLSAHRTAWAANSITSGIDWRGCAKGYIVLSLLNGRHNRFTKTGEPVERLTYAFETFPNSKGEIALTEQSRERAERELAAKRAKLADLEKKNDAYKAKHNRTNYAFENRIPGVRRRVHRLEDALAKLDNGA